ncbi:MAG: PD40 domain-containing protein, partial [Acidobacteria bacterium]|nr:PD40 domain-containing protein [Acidobacteriota bacterium]
GGKARRITDLFDDARQPAWSPDGRRIAFQSYRNGTWDIWTIEPDGSNPAAITSGPFDDREPHWSPDGARVAFSSDRSGNYDIWALELATGKVQRVTADPGNDVWPAWSPDGREIAFVASGRTAPGIYAVSLQGGERMLAPSNGMLGGPVWMPRAESVVFSALSNGVTRLMLGDRELSADEDVFPFRPNWAATQGALEPSLIYSADGHIKERRGGGAGAIRVVPFEADLPVMRARYTPRTRDFDSTTPRRALGIVRPGLSPDGERVVFAALGDVWIARRGQAPTRVTDDAHEDTDPAWSPDGTRLAYASDREGSLDIWVRDLASGAERRVTRASGPEMRPTWSPDGTTLAFVTVMGAVNGQLAIVNVTNGQITRLLDTTNGPINPGWSADGRTVYASVLRTYSSRFREGVNQVLAVPVGGGDGRAITLVPDVSSGKRGEGPAWSPDGRHVATVLNGQVHVMPLTPTGEPAGTARALWPGSADQVSWSADSGRVLFSDGNRLVLAPIDGGQPQDWPIDLTYTRRIPPDSLVIHAGRLVDGVERQARKNMDIVVARNRIARVVPHADAEHAVRVVDASQLTVMPGLIEAHGHYAAEYGGRFGRIHLAYGITSVRSPGGHPYASAAEREAVDSGRRPGARLFFNGYLMDGTRVFYPMAATAPTEAAIDREIELARRLEYDLVKTYVRLPDALQKRAIEGAHRIGIPVSSHEVYPAAAFGVDGVEHFSATSRRGYSPKLSPLLRVYDDVVAVVAESGMTVTPTLSLGRARPAIMRSPELRSDPRWQIQPEWVRGQFGPDAAARDARPQQLPGTLMAYHKAGVPIIAGTDSPLVPYGISLHLELEIYVAAGLTPFEALQTATVNVARALRAERDLGTVERGKLADFAIVEGNPLVDIRDTRKVQMVVVNGLVMRVEELTAGTRGR